MTVEAAVIAVGREEGRRAQRLAEIGVDLAEAGAEITLVHAFETAETANETAARLGLADGSAADLARRLNSVRQVVRALEKSGVSVDVDGRVVDLLPPLKGWDSHGTAPLSWDIVVCSLVDMTRLLAGPNYRYSYPRLGVRVTFCPEPTASGSKGFFERSLG